MKIALLDLNHCTRGIHTNTVPLGLGCLVSYARREIAVPFQVEMFKETDKALAQLKNWQPDLLGITQYCWNSQLNLYVANLLKKEQPGCFIIAGGPNLDTAKEARIKFLAEYPWVDLCVSYDGEVPFVEVLKRLFDNEPLERILQTPPAGTYSLDKKTGSLIESKERPPRLKSLDVLGPMFSRGLFDSFLNDGFHPFLQTHRGCPFTCAFCHTSDRYYSKMLFLSPEIFRQEMVYLGKRLSGRHDVTLYLANTNMGLFKEDFEIAAIIKETQEKYDWPRFINVNSGKDTKKLIQMLSIIKFHPAIALQTLTERVLTNIERKNIPFNEFVNFQREVSKKTGETSSTELILCLPGETKETFLETLKKVLNSEVKNIVIYTLMNLKGTPLSGKEREKKYSYIKRYRVVPRQFSEINSTKILDMEEVIVGTNTMSFEDYLELRSLSFTVTTFFNPVEFIPLKRLLSEHKVDIAEWILDIHARIKEVPVIRDIFADFLYETRKELFSTPQDLLIFFEDPLNFKALCNGEYGDNLLRKYKCRLLSLAYKEALELITQQAEILLSKRLGPLEAKSLLLDMKQFLLTRDVRSIFSGGFCVEGAVMHLRYDIPKWLENTQGDSLLENYASGQDFVVDFDSSLREKARKFSSMNKDFELSLQMLYRDGNISEFWPKLKAIVHGEKLLHKIV